MLVNKGPFVSLYSPVLKFFYKFYPVVDLVKGKTIDIYVGTMQLEWEQGRNFTRSCEKVVGNVWEHIKWENVEKHCHYLCAGVLGAWGAWSLVPVCLVPECLVE